MSTKTPSKVAGVKLKPAGKLEDIADKNRRPLKNTKPFFRISSKKNSGSFETMDESWYFALLPAIDNNMQFSPNSNLKGAMQVPEVKPGILNNSTMKYKSQIIPGGSPAIQAIGIQSTQYQLVGLFIGTEGRTRNSTTLNTDDKNGSGAYPDAVNKADRFRKEYVENMSEVYIEVSADTLYSYKGVITNFKYYQRRDDRVYFVIDILGTQYA
jgi:hypothetical protein